MHFFCQYFVFVLRFIRRRNVDKNKKNPKANAGNPATYALGICAIKRLQYHYMRKAEKSQGFLRKKIKGRSARPKVVIMTNSEFWKLKVGDSFYDSYSNRLVTVVKREVCDETCGFVMSKHSCRDIKTGYKYVQLTVKEDDGKTWFYDSTRKDRVSKLELIDRFDQAAMARIEAKLKNGFRWI